MDRLVQAGTLPSYREAGRRVGISHVRMSEICALAGLAPDIQEAILLGRLVVTERALRPVVRALLWSQQHDALTSTSAGD